MLHTGSSIRTIALHRFSVISDQKGVFFTNASLKAESLPIYMCLQHSLAVLEPVEDQPFFSKKKRNRPFSIFAEILSQQAPKSFFCAPVHFRAPILCAIPETPFHLAVLSHFFPHKAVLPSYYRTSSPRPFSLNNISLRLSLPLPAPSLPHYSPPLPSWIATPSQALNCPARPILTRKNHTRLTGSPKQLFSISLTTTRYSK